VPSKLPLEAAEEIDIRRELAASWPVRTPLAGIPALLNMKASVPSAEKTMWFFPIELR